MPTLWDAFDVGIVKQNKSEAGGLVPAKHDFNLDNFSGGLNNRDPDTLVAGNQLTDGLNVIALDVGSLKKRDGYKALLATALSESIVNMFEFNRYSGVSIYLVSTPTKLYKLNATMDGVTELTLPAGVTLTTGVKAFFTIKDKCYMLTGTYYLVYDGTTITEVAYTPTTEESTAYGANSLTQIKKCTKVAIHKTRAFFTGDPENPHRVYFSHLDNVAYCPANYIITFYTALGDKITGIINFAESIVVTKTGSIAILNSNDPDPLKWQFVRLNVHTGAISGDAVVPISSYLVFPSNEGFYALTNINVVGALATTAISELIPKTIKEVGDFSNAVAIYNNGLYYCKAGEYTLVYDYHSPNEVKPWWVWNNIPANKFMKTNTDKLWFCANDGQIYEFEEGVCRDKATYDAQGAFTGGEAITAYAFTKNFDLDFPSSLKQFKKFRLLVMKPDVAYTAKYGTGSTIEFTCLVDWVQVLHKEVVATVSLWGIAQWGDPFSPATKGELIPQRIPKRGRTFMFGFRNSKIDEPFVIYELVGKFKEKAI